MSKIEFKIQQKWLFETVKIDGIVGQITDIDFNRPEKKLGYLITVKNWTSTHYFECFSGFVKL